MPTSKYLARTALATAIARVDRQRFNEAVAEGFYPCAPRTVKGASRVFDVNGILCLWVYGVLTEEGVVPRRAGAIACELQDLLKEYPETDRVVHVTDGFFRATWLRRQDIKPEDNFISGVNIVSVREWFLEFPRKRIIHELEQEARKLGADDEAEE